MLSNEDRYSDTFTFYQGFKNVAYITGVLRRISPDQFFVQQTNNANLMLPIQLRRGESIPKKFEEYLPIKVVARVLGDSRKEEGERVAVLEALDFDTPSVLEMPPEDAWLKPVPKEAKVDEFKPKQMGMKLSDSSNVVQLAGCVSAVYLEPPSPFDQNGSNRTLVVLLQQTASRDKCIPLRFYGKFNAAIKDRIPIGSRIYVEGKFRIKVVPVGEADSNGIQPVKCLPYIHCTKPLLATHKVIREIPYWADDLKKMFVKSSPKSEFAEQMTSGAISEVQVQSPSIATLLDDE